MRVLIQRVSSASVTIDGKVSGQIDQGLLVLLGVEDADTQEDIDWLCGKITRMRIFNDEDQKMNRSVVDVDGGLLVVSQFTLFASTKKGNRPGFTRSAKPDVAIPLYEAFVKTLSFTALRQVETGEFGAMMDIALVNDGPTTIWLDSKAKE
ncbi:MAG: D-aminoacyl-tRNA deacylase [Bacteroidota bacterium]